MTSAHPRRILVIRNPSAGVAAALTPGGGSIDALRALLERHAIAAEVIEPEDEDSARAAVRKAVADRVDVVVAAGGDGTVHMVADELLGSDSALGILPMGRVMNIARALGIGRDPELAARGSLPPATSVPSTSARPSRRMDGPCRSSKRGPSA